MSRKLEFLETSNDLYAINNSFSYLKNPYGHKINITEKVIDDNMLSDRGSSLDIPGLSIEKMDKKVIDETTIKNVIKEAWKENDKLDSKLNSFKTNVTKAKEPLINAKNLEILNKAILKKEAEGEGGI